MDPETNCYLQLDRRMASMYITLINARDEAHNLADTPGADCTYQWRWLAEELAACIDHLTELRAILDRKPLSE